MTRTSYTPTPHVPGDRWGVWVGPGPEPVTGRRYHATRYQNHFLAEALRRRRTSLLQSAARDWLLWLTTDPLGLVVHQRIQSDLVGKRLGCSVDSHGLILARLADGVPVRAILRELDDLEAPTLDLFPRVLS